MRASIDFFSVSFDREASYWQGTIPGIQKIRVRDRLRFAAVRPGFTLHFGRYSLSR